MEHIRLSAPAAGDLSRSFRCARARSRLQPVRSANPPPLARKPVASKRVAA